MADKPKKQTPKRTSGKSKAEAEDPGAEASPSWDEATQSWWRDVTIATRHLTLIPLPGPYASGEAALGDARRAFVIVGLGIGLIAAVAYGIGHLLSLTAFPAALLALAAAAVITRGESEKGFADFAEGVFQGADRASRLAAVQAAPLGYAGIAALIFSVLLRASLIAVAAGQGAGTATLIAALIAAYTATAHIAQAFPGAEGDSLDGLAGPDETGQLWVSTAAGALLVFLFLAGSAGTLSALVAVLLGAAGAYLAAWAALNLTAGMTRPALMAGAQTVQILVMIGAVAHF